MSLPTKERLIDAAIKLIESGDPKSFSVAKVAKDLGISQGNVTYHYPKREDLIESVVERLILRYTVHFKVESEKHPDDIISKGFLRFMLSDARTPAVVNTFIFLWSNALTNEKVAMQLAGFYQKTILKHLDLSGYQDTPQQTEATHALLTVAGIVNGMIPILGIANSSFDHEAFTVYLESLLSNLMPSVKKHH